MQLHKDEALDWLAKSRNIAQFVSLRPEAGGLRLHFSRIEGYEPNAAFGRPMDAVSALLAASREGAVNIRSYTPDSPRSREFVYGLRNMDDVSAEIERLAADGLHLIVNETVDVRDGGVSGVVLGDAVEFAPDDTPRCVERPGTASLPLPMGVAILEIVYGFRPEIDAGEDERIEFSIHPAARGVRRGHTLVWEREQGVAPAGRPVPRWPNRFSRHVGDKAFGLLVADQLGLPVPRATVVGRRVKPFSFGRCTGTPEVWTRTCPVEPEPGLFTTSRGWLDPFRLLQEEDPLGDRIASVMSQAAVRAKYSGAALADADGLLVVEGRGGTGEAFMLGHAPPAPLPPEVEDDVREAYRRIEAALGPARFEWVHDGETLWVVQLHSGGSKTRGDVIVPGEAGTWIPFDAAGGVGGLAQLLDALPPGTGVVLQGAVGMTSHLADLLRRRGGPARLART